jgi:hypothetical protein
LFPEQIVECTPILGSQGFDPEFHKTGSAGSWRNGNVTPNINRGCNPSLPKYRVRYGQISTMVTRRVVYLRVFSVRNILLTSLKGCGIKLGSGEHLKTRFATEFLPWH